MRYTLTLVRRFIAILLAVSFSYLLAGAAFAASLQPNLPSCCRKGGKHHCVMQAVGAASGSAIVSVHEKCPCFPKAFLTAHQEADTITQTAGIFAGWISHPGGSPQIEAGYRISYQRSHQKRGPPSPSVLS